MSSTTTSFNFSGTNITMTCSPVKKKVEEVVFEMGGEPIKELKMPYTMKDVMIAEGYKFVNGKGDKCFCDDCDNYGEVKWTGMEAFVCRDCAKTIMRNVKKFTDQW